MRDNAVRLRNRLTGGKSLREFFRNPAVLASLSLILIVVYGLYLWVIPTKGQVQAFVEEAHIENWPIPGTPPQFRSPQEPEIHSRLRFVVPFGGTVVTCVADEDAGRNYCVDLCRDGLLVRRSLFGIKSIELPETCRNRVERGKRTTALLKYALEHVKQLRGSASLVKGVGGDYAVISAAPLVAPRTIGMAKELIEDPASITRWTRLILNDLWESWSLRQPRIEEPWAADLGDAGVQFQIGRGGSAARFGVTSFKLDDFGQIASETVTYKIVAVEYDSTSGWKLVPATVAPREVPVHLDLIIETGRRFRKGLYWAGLIALTLALLLAGAKLVGIVRGRGTKEAAQQGKSPPPVKKAATDEPAGVS